MMASTDLVSQSDWAPVNRGWHRTSAGSSRRGHGDAEARTMAGAIRPPSESPRPSFVSPGCCGRSGPVQRTKPQHPCRRTMTRLVRVARPTHERLERFRIATRRYQVATLLDRADRLASAFLANGQRRFPFAVRGRWRVSSYDWRRRGIVTTRDAAVDSCATDASRNSEGLTRQRPAALTTVAVF